MELVCPPPTALADIPANTCPVQFDQIVRFAIQRSGQASFTAVTIKVVATWTPLLAADDNTKVVLTPLFAEMVLPQSTALTAGGNDNTTVNGIPDYNGEGFVSVTGQIRGLSAAQAEALRSYTSESISNSIGGSNLEIIFINRYGTFIVDATHGFKVYNFRLSSVGSEGLNAKNKHQFGFDLAPGWDKGAVMIKPTDFDPLTLTA